MGRRRHGGASQCTSRCWTSPLVARLKRGSSVAEAPGQEIGGVAADGRPVLEAVAGSRADEERRSASAGGGRSGSRRSSCSRTGRRATRPAAAPPAPGSGAPCTRGRRRGRRRWAVRSPVSGSNGGAVLVVRDLEAAALEIREAVVDVAVVEVGPAGQVAGLEAVVAALGREEEHFLARREDAAAEERPGTPSAATGRTRTRSARRVSVSPAVVRIASSVAPSPGRHDRGEPILAARRHELLHQRLHGAPRHQCAEIRLEQSELDAVPAICGIALRQLARGRARRGAAPARGAPRCSGRRTARAGRRNQHADRMEDRQARPRPTASASRRASPRPCACRFRRRRRSCASCATRRRRMRGRWPGRRRRAAGRAGPLAQVPGGPGAEDAGADDDGVPVGGGGARRG